MAAINELPSEHDDVFGSDMQSFLRTNIGDFIDVQSVSEGYSHKVYRLINTHNASFYLKVRGTTYARLPHLKLEPQDIRFEKKALEISYNAAPDAFPVVVGFNKELHALLISDVLPDGDTLEHEYARKNITPYEIGRIGSTLGRVHALLAQISEPIHEDNDEIQYARNLKHKITKFNDPRLDAVAAQLRSLPKRQLIFADLHPRNIGIRSNKDVCFFDLEQMHMGNPEFDLGFFIAHLNLHSEDPNEFIDLEEVFLENYAANNPSMNLDSELIGRISAGIIFYRLSNVGIPYYAYPSEKRSRQLLEESDERLGGANPDNLA